MTIGHFIKKKLEEKYLGTTVSFGYRNNDIVKSIEVRDGGQDIPFHITIKSNLGLFMYLETADHDLPEIL